MKHLKESERRLKALGPSRETQEQQHKYLLRLATQFQTTTTQALEANYGSDDAFDLKPSLKLATAVVSRNESFSNDVWQRGRTMEFSRQLTIQKPVPEPISDIDDWTSGLKKKSKKGRLSNWLADTSPPATPPLERPLAEMEDTQLATRYHVNSEDLEDILFKDYIVAAPEKGIMEWLEKVYKNSRGFEMGTFHSSLMQIMWKKQSSKWENLALGFTSDMVSITHTYICDLLKEICADDRLRANLLSVMMDKLVERYKRAIDQTHFILQVERNPLTVNHYFADNLEKCNQQRMKAAMKDKAFHDDEHGDIFKLSDLDHTTSMSNTQSTIQLLHDILKSYYKVARKRFTDTVIMQASDYHLVRGPDTAIKVFSPSFVSDLTAEQLERIAGEDALTKRKRADLTRQVENLKKAKSLLVAV